MDKLLPHPDLCKGDAFETFARAILQADKALGGSSLKWKDVRTNSLLADWDDATWNQFSIVDSQLISETFSALLMIGYIAIGKGKPTKIIKADVTDSARDWYAIGDDDQSARGAFRDALATAWFAQLDTSSLDAFDNGITAMIGEQEQETVEATYQLLKTYELVSPSDSVPASSSSVAEPLDEVTIEQPEEDTLLDLVDDSPEDDGLLPMLEDDTIASRPSAEASDAVADDEGNVVEQLETDSSDLSLEEDNSVDESFDDASEDDDPFSDIQFGSNDVSDDDGVTEPEETDIPQNNVNSGELKSDLSGEKPPKATGGPSSITAGKFTYDDDDTLPRSGFDDMMTGVENQPSAKDAKSDSDEGSDDGFKSVVSDEKPPTINNTPPKQEMTNDDNLPPALTPGQKSGLRDRRNRNRNKATQSTQNEQREAQKKKPPVSEGANPPTTEEKSSNSGGGDLPPMIRPGEGSGLRDGNRTDSGGIKFNPRRGKRGSNNRNEPDLPEIRPGGVTRRSNKSGAGVPDPEGLPSKRPEGGSIFGRKQGKTNLPGGGNKRGSGLDAFRRAGRNNNSSDGGNGGNITPDKVEHIIGGVIDGVKIDIVLRNDTQYEIHENDERVFYVSHIEVEQWQNQHGEEHIADAVMNYRDNFVRGSMKHRDNNDEE